MDFRFKRFEQNRVFCGMSNNLNIEYYCFLCKNVTSIDKIVYYLLVNYLLLNFIYIDCVCLNLKGEKIIVHAFNTVFLILLGIEL